MKRQYQPSKIRRKRQHGFLNRNSSKSGRATLAQSPPRRTQTPDPGLTSMAGKPSVRLRFPRSSRMKQPGDFARAKAQGQRLVCGCLIANVAPRPSGLGQPPGRRHQQKDRRRRRAQPRPPPVARKLSAAPARIGAPGGFGSGRPASIAGKGLAEVERDFLRAVKQARLETDGAMNFVQRALIL